MCGRFTLRTPTGAIAEHFAVLDLPPMEPRYNIAPTQQVAVVRAAGPGPGAARRCDLVRWGLIPSWAKDPSIGARLINARSETAAVKPAFRTALRRRRCLVTADGFYEWQRTGSTRQPFFFHREDDGPFGLAGLWETWDAPDGTEIVTCTILTTEADVPVRSIHDRMPIVVAPDEYAKWLDPAAAPSEPLSGWLTPMAPGSLSARPVSPWVNSPTHEGPHCTEPS